MNLKKEIIMNDNASSTTIAVLEVKESVDIINDMSHSELTSNTSSRSSTSTIDRSHDTPLELGLVISALQNSLVEQESEQNQLKKQVRPPSKTAEVTSAEKPNGKKSKLSVAKVIKREDAVIVDYELDRGIKSVTKEINTFSANIVVLDKIDAKSVKPNTLTPREQEKADEAIKQAIDCLFNNQFMKAKYLFELNAKTDPLHALGLGSMMFLKAVTTTSPRATKDALGILMSTYTLASAQIDNTVKRNVGGTVLQYISSYYNSIKISRGTGVPTNVKIVNPKALEAHKVNTIPNGVLRAHVVKAETCLQMAILYLLQENASGYVKCGLNLRRAYTSYSIVWQEYKRTGQLHNEYIDGDTISGVQFGIGTVHLILSSLPKKVLRVVSAFGWKADKHLGFALLKLCVESRRARSTLSSLTLLAYYTTLTEFCPHILSTEYTQPAIETLLDAQKIYPNSSLFLYFAGRTSRLARNLNLSSQSFMYAIETGKNEWAEVEIFHACTYETAFNWMMQSQWQEAADLFDRLFRERYWSPVIIRYLTGACLDMMGNRTEAILIFADIPDLAKQQGGKSNTSTGCIEQYILRKIRLFQSSGYQDMDMTMCALEYLYLFNAYGFMGMDQLVQNLTLIDYALSKILEAEKLEYGIRTKELLPETPPPQYYDQRGTLLLIKASILNSMERYTESIIHLNWIVDHKDKIATDKWIVPYAYWEVGMTSWNLEQKARGRMFWEKALSYTDYDFEFRLAMKVNLAMTRAEEMGIQRLDNFDMVPKINNQQQYNTKHSRAQGYENGENRESLSDVDDLNVGQTMENSIIEHNEHEVQQRLEGSIEELVDEDTSELKQDDSIDKESDIEDEENSVLKKGNTQKDHPSSVCHKNTTPVPTNHRVDDINNQTIKVKTEHVNTSSIEEVDITSMGSKETISIKKQNKKSTDCINKAIGEHSDLDEDNAVYSDKEKGTIRSANRYIKEKSLDKSDLPDKSECLDICSKDIDPEKAHEIVD